MTVGLSESGSIEGSNGWLSSVGVSPSADKFSLPANESVNLGSERYFTVGLVLLLMPVRTQATGTGHNGIRSMHGKLGLAATRVRN